ncbi:MAG TPA: hypothetical protein VNC78_03480 [Actinomycetota bacterium]|nr:hypothetical protein [Actinomycetota bacterium]
MIKRLLLIALGAAAALEADRWWGRQRQRFTPNAVTGAFLDKLNRSLENRSSEPPRG